MSLLKEELTLVKYQDLKNKFDELGVSEVWRQGKKKIDMINEAVEILSEMEATGEKSDVAIEEIVKDKKIEAVVTESKFELAVLAIVEKKELYTLASITKKCRQLQNIFLQHRGSAKGKEALGRYEILVEATKRMF